MKFKFFMPFACLCGLMTVATGCNNNDEVDLLSTPIRLSAFTEDEGGAKTRAVSDFPNSQKIYIKGAFAPAENNWTAADRVKVDWTNDKDHLYIMDAEATATGEVSGTFSFTWTTPQYWPLPGTKVKDNVDYKFLSFFAYSPEVDETNFTLTTEADTDKLKFNLTLTELNGTSNVQTMPDVLYTYQGATADRARNTVNLGKFCHALSQVQVVLNTTNVSPNVFIKELSIRLSKSGSFIHDGWLSEDTEVNTTTFDPIYTHSDKNNTITYYKYNDADETLGGATKAIFLNSGMASTGTPFLVLPNDPNALVTLTYVDKTMGGEGVTKTNTWTVDNFLQRVGDTTIPASLDRGKKTTLELTITGNEITTITGNLVARGTDNIYETTHD